MPLHKTIVKWLFAIYTSCIIANFWMIENTFFEKNMMFVRFFGGIGLLLGAFLYFREVFLSEKIINVYHRLSFWVITGSMFYYLITVPIIIFDKFLYDHQDIYLSILVCCNIVLYGSFIIGFIIHRRRSNNAENSKLQPNRG
ncbi:hypothetical protein [Joostella sp. CR20]|uniref:hypothetical protein n=1 Tax=Joostella sp. CR20 TaxID=2804312 RepID=UPI00313ABE09